MFRHILVPVTGDDNDGPVCAAAFAVAHRFGSHLQFLHVEPDLRQTLVAMAPGHVVGGGGSVTIGFSMHWNVVWQKGSGARSLPSMSAASEKSYLRRANSPQVCLRPNTSLRSARPRECLPSMGGRPT